MRRTTEYILGLTGGIMGILFSIYAMYFYRNKEFVHVILHTLPQIFKIHIS
ncbi:hypothetical protein IC1_04633 [Bacillus cereus VD022]|uniref:Uncharacterized protein n=1 Tax=Bacillus cereus TIAC219 TaxID=718222 RepID=A0ABC9SR32_BACCE|nr:hypothetical protein IC1_04633 [Bacillus cereus VD022]EOQ58090.1 hypothetical protein IAY_03732 [Bacillus cereus TIAC219]